MIRTLANLLRTGHVTQDTPFPDLPAYSRGLPMVTDKPCDGCRACADACPTDAIAIDCDVVSLDRGRCVACGECVDACPTGTIVADRRTRVAVLRREDLILTNGPKPVLNTKAAARPSPFRGSIHIRSVSTGDNASDLELQATGNPIFDTARFGVHVVASPRAADCLVVTGPVARAMREPLRRCYEAMAEPRVVLAAGAAAISGVPFEGGYAEANGVDAVLPVDVYVPGNPPHPWYLIHGLKTLMDGDV